MEKLNSSTWYTKPVDAELREEYDFLPKEDKIRLKKSAKSIGATKFEYLEEILIDYDNAFKIANSIIYNLDFDINYQDLTKIILFCGIGVAKRTSKEISIVSGVYEKVLDFNKKDLLETYGNHLEEICDEVYGYLNLNEKNNKRKIYGI